MARPRKGEEKHAAERVAFRIPTWVRAGLDHLSAEREVPLSEIANDAFATYLKKHGIKPEPVQRQPPDSARSRSAKVGPP
jgi:hypothetical protein